jgi:hypothetical protein
MTAPTMTLGEYDRKVEGDLDSEFLREELALGYAAVGPSPRAGTRLLWSALCARVKTVLLWVRRRWGMAAAVSRVKLKEVSDHRGVGSDLTGYDKGSRLSSARSPSPPPTRQGSCRWSSL